MTKLYRTLLFLVLSFAMFDMSHSQAIITSFSSNQKVEHNLWNSLLQEHVDNEGWVDYEGFSKGSVKLHAYLHSLASMPPKEHWSRSEKLAYYINTYNAYTVALILSEYPLASIKDIDSP